MEIKTALSGSVEELERQKKVSYWDNARRLDLVAGLVKSKENRILDFGSGYGLFVDFACANGLQAEGYEPGGRATIRSPDYQCIFDIEDESYDIVTCFHVIEHVESPYLLVNQLLSLCKSGGCVVIETPNLTCLANKVCPALLEYQLGNERHITNFTYESLNELLSSFDCKVTVGTQNRYSVLNLAHWIKYGEPQSEPHFSNQPGQHYLVDRYLFDCSDNGDTLIAVLEKKDEDKAGDGES